jgi:hypothetical protein
MIDAICSRCPVPLLLAMFYFPLKLASRRYYVDITRDLTLHDYMLCPV